MVNPSREGGSGSAPPRASVVIRCYNEERHIGVLLDGLLHQSIADLEIVVVDSGSTDRSLEIVGRYPVKLVQIAQDEFSFGRSLNLGIRHTTGEFVVLASAHVYPLFNDWIERLLRPFADPDVAIVYGKQRGAETTRYSEHQIFKCWFPDTPSANQSYPFCNNANAALRRSVWNRLPYDESLTGLEDIAWAKQALALGYKVLYQADAVIAHVHQESMGQIVNRYRREAIAMKMIYPDIRFSLWDFLRLSTANIVSDWRAARREGVLREHFFDIPAFRLPQFWGTFRGYAQHGPVTRRLRRHLYYPGAADESAVESPAPRGARIDYSLRPAGGRRGRDH